MDSKSPCSRVIPIPNGRTSWLINGGDPNHLLNGMVLQVERADLVFVGFAP